MKIGKGKIYRTWCLGVRDRVRRDVKVQICLGKFVKWEGRPQGINLHAYFSISGKEDIWAPLGDGRMVFIHSQTWSQSETGREAEGRRCLHERFF